MGLKPEKDLKAAEEAALWLQRLREQDSPEVRASFSAWIRHGAANLEEFLFAQALWKEMDHIDAGMRQRLWSAGSADGVVEFPDRAAAKPQARAVRRQSRWLAAAAVLVAIAAGTLLMTQPDWPNWLERLDPKSTVYATDLGEQTSVKLDDGSVMHLNTSSRAQVRLTSTARVVRLAAGEALFTVEKDARRPFYVLTDNARIRVLGTQFNVYRSSGTQTRVAVVNGMVQVSSLHAAPASAIATSAQRHGTESTSAVQLQAGDEANIEREQVFKARAASVERAVSWRARRLMFPGNPLSEIVAQFNRYNRVPIRIDGAEIGARRMSGVFDADDSAPLFEYLAKDPKVEVVRSGGEILIRARAGEAATAAPQAH